VVAQRRRTAPDEGTLPYAWVLTDEGWRPAAGGPSFATPLGVVAGRLVVQEDLDAPGALWALHVVDVGGRPLLLGVTAADDGPARPAAALLQDGTWEQVAAPPAVPYGTPAVAGDVVAGTVQLPGDGPAIALLDLADDRWRTIRIPVEGDGAAVGYPPAAWDGADVVWFHGGLGTTVHLALDLATDALSTAQPGSDEVGPLVWDGAGLLRWGYGLTGPFGIHRWTPAD
jgi:hypothetical protein